MGQLPRGFPEALWFEHSGHDRCGLKSTILRLVLRWRAADLPRDGGDGGPLRGMQHHLCETQSSEFALGTALRALERAAAMPLEHSVQITEP